MKILNTNQLVSERVKIKPVTNADFCEATKNPYGLTKNDLIGCLRDFPMGVVVKMVEEQEAQGNKPDVKVFQKNFSADKNHNGFDWSDTIIDKNKYEKNFMVFLG